ncbi:MAG: sigma-54-dependent Fis family transcriptional regulator [Deltaproteobacteria bacterium]|nr:sigma-54-dependent Fis family transcriptional regulator [Deltaproteobacteria bacterium]
MATTKILVVDDEEIVCLSCYRILKEEGYEVQTCLSAREGLQLLAEDHFDLAIVDLKMPGMDGLELLQAIKVDHPHIPVIMITGFSTVESAVEAMKAGAYDYLPKPFTPDQVALVVKKALDNRSMMLENLYLRGELQSKYRFENIVGSSQKMQDLYRLIARVAPTNSTVLITGESGTGKELIARALHYNSLRKDRQFIPVDCAVLSENLLESELFGHVKGSFTGAIVTKPGLFEVADGGTLFLDEIGNISLAMQSKLLRFIQEREFTPVGGTKMTKVDIRLIAATNKDLMEKIKEGTFREDLFYRLNIVPIHLPPLRERAEDIPLLAQHFLQKYRQEMGRALKKISPAAAEMLMRYSWPGNVRELENIMERVIIMTDEELIQPRHLPLSLQESPEGISLNIPKTSEELKDLKKHLRDKSVEEAERLFVLGALTRNDWNVTRSAKEVGMLRPNFQALMRKHNIRAEDRED